MTVTTLLFYLFAAIIVVAAFRVVTARSPAIAAMHLVLVFFTASMLWMLIEVEFLALLLVLIYVGAVMVMFLFVIMMLDINKVVIQAGARRHLPLGLTVAAIMVAEMAFVLGRTWLESGPPAELPVGYNSTFAVGVAMYTEYAYGIQLAGALLLVGMVAAISLTLRRRSDVKRNIPSEQIRTRAADRLQVLQIKPVSSRAEGAAAPAADNKGEQA